jgi:hypothetical protein
MPEHFGHDEPDLQGLDAQGLHRRHRDLDWVAFPHDELTRPQGAGNRPAFDFAGGEVCVRRVAVADVYARS